MSFHSKPAARRRRPFFYGSVLEPSKVIKEEFAFPIISQELIYARIKQLADDVFPLVRGLKTTFVQLGTGALFFFADMIRQHPFAALAVRTIILSAKGYNGTTQTELEHNASSYPGILTDYHDTEVFVLVDEVRHTGQSMHKMVRFFHKRFPQAKVLTMCLIDRPDCNSPGVYPSELDFVGFKVNHHPDSFEPNGDPDQPTQGWLVGYGMDIGQLYYRPSRTIWWTMVKPSIHNKWEMDQFYRPLPTEYPIVTVHRGIQANIPLATWKQMLGRSTPPGARTVSNHR